MTPLLAAAVAAGILGWLYAAVLLALYLGERSRRTGAENAAGIFTGTATPARPITASDMSPRRELRDKGLEVEDMAKRIREKYPDLPAEKASTAARRAAAFVKGTPL